MVWLVRVPARGLQESGGAEADDEQRADEHRRALTRQGVHLPEQIAHVPAGQGVAGLLQLVGGDFGVARNATVALLAELRGDVVQRVRDVAQEGRGVVLALCRQFTDLVLGVVQKMRALLLDAADLLLDTRSVGRTRAVVHSRSHATPPF